jgi:hypothetical protein
MSQRRRLTQFCQQTSGGLYDTALLSVDNCRPCDSGAITQWRLTEVTRRPSCFGCQRSFSSTLRPAAFLTASGANRQAGTAVSACCTECWVNKPADQIEAAALGVLRRHLNKKGRLM